MVDRRHEANKFLTRFEIPDWTPPAELEDSDDLAWASNTLQEVKTLMKELDDSKRKFLREPLDEVNALRKMFAPYEKSLAHLERTLKSLIGAFKQEQERQRRRAEEEMQKRIEEQRAADNADDDTPWFTPISVADDTSAAASGISTRETWVVESVDTAALVQAAAQNPNLLTYLQPALPAINAMVKNTRGNHNIPGVKARRSDTVVVRT